MMTDLRKIARSMLYVGRGTTAKDQMVNIRIKQARILTNLEIRLQADCAINSCAYYAWQKISSVMSM